MSIKHLRANLSDKCDHIGPHSFSHRRLAKKSIKSEIRKLNRGIFHFLKNTGTWRVNTGEYQLQYCLLAGLPLVLNRYTYTDSDE